MKAKELLYLLGWQPAPRVYGHRDLHFDLPTDGKVPYAQWLHPKARPYQVTQAQVDELRRLLSPGDLAIDIGAHTGDTTLPLALAVGPTGLVLALEPNPYVYAILLRTAELFHATQKGRIAPYAFAVTPEDGPIEFEYSDPGFCNGGRHEGVSRWRHNHAFKLKVEGRNLVKLLREKHADVLPRLRLIKVDAEGYDYTILRSLEPLLREFRPVIRAEVYRFLSADTRRELHAYLIGLGYQVHRMESLENMQGPKLTADEMLTAGHFDLLALHANRTYQA